MTIIYPDLPLSDTPKGPQTGQKSALLPLSLPPTIVRVPAAMTTLAPDDNLSDRPEYPSRLPYPLPHKMPLGDIISAPPYAPSDSTSGYLSSFSATSPHLIATSKGEL